VDGGTKDSGDKLVELIRDTYGTEVVDLVISSHPDGDHASGLTVVLNELMVKALWLHKPWAHSPEISHLFVDGRITDTSIKQTLRESLEHANELEQIARRKGIPVVEPFAGETWLNLPLFGASLGVLGPSREYYDSLLPHFRDCPEVKCNVATGFSASLSRAYAAVVEAVKKVFEQWGLETLTDPTEDISCENNSSVILLVDVAGEKTLLTADAGAPALTHAADFAARYGIDLMAVKRVQVPHHGSRRNVGPTILNRILGPKLASSDPRVDQKSAIASVAVEGAPKHPAKKVLNAFKRRGAKCFETKGTSFCWRSPGAPLRQGYGPADAVPFYNEVDE
jgi:beta-lactamase superfamily II metal-dependent hydrolase